MEIKKNDIYRSLQDSLDQRYGGMDASFAEQQSPVSSTGSEAHALALFHESDDGGFPSRIHAVRRTA